MLQENTKGERFHSLRKQRKWLLLTLLVLLLLLIFLLGRNSWPTAPPVEQPTATPPNPFINNPNATTITINATLSGGSITIVQIETGVKITITGSTLPNGTEIRLTSVYYGQNLPSGISNTIPVGIAYYDVKVTQASGMPLDPHAKISLYLENSLFRNVNTMYYWNGQNWTRVNTQLVEVDTLFGTFTPSELTGTPIEVNVPLALPVPEVPTGTILAAATCLAAFLVFKIRPNQTTHRKGN